MMFVAILFAILIVQQASAAAGVLGAAGGAAGGVPDLGTVLALVQELLSVVIISVTFLVGIVFFEQIEMTEKK